jgi:predicted AAA+ superfamily ATPase
MSEDIQKYRFLMGRMPDPSRKRLVILTGARQTGKTTLVKAAYPGLPYVNLDAPENREAVRAIASASWARDVGIAILDEAQKEPSVFEKVKYAYDDGALPFSVLLGSSQILLLKRIRETLAGRVSLFELWPLMMSEIREAPSGGFPVAGHASGKPLSPPLVDRLFTAASLKDIFEDVPGVLLDREDETARRAEAYLLQWGGMPGLLPLTDDERRQWLKDYGFTYLERDLGDLARLDDLSPFRKFQRLTALRSGCLLNYSELARDAAVSVDTARRYLEYLRLSYQTVLLHPYHVNLTSTVVKTPKVYWLDIGLLRLLSGMSGAITGEIYETMVVGELMKWMKTAGRDGEIYFYRTRSGLEVDILLDTPDGVVGMEIKSRRVIAQKDVTALKEVARGLGSRWRGGLVIYLGDAIKPLADPQIWAIPSRRLFV